MIFSPSFSFLSKALFWEILIRNSPSACSPAVLLLALSAGTLPLQPFCQLGAGTPPVRCLLQTMPVPSPLHSFSPGSQNE